MRKNGLDSIKRSKVNDFILVVAFLVIALICMIILSFSGKKGSYVKVSIQGKEEGVYDLSKNQMIDISYDNEEFSNQVMIKNGEAYMENANCQDKICVNHKPISKDGETIVCLPHKLVIEIVDKTIGNEIQEKEFDGITN